MENIIEKVSKKGFDAKNEEEAMIFMLTNFSKFRHRVEVGSWTNNHKNVSFHCPETNELIVVSGEFFYNEKLKRYEHEHVTPSGDCYIIVN